MNPTIPADVCLCGAGGCNTPEAIAIRAQVEAERERARRLNNAAFERFWNDRAAGRPTRPVGEYLKEAEADVA
jgi:hypothetical protein